MSKVQSMPIPTINDTGIEPLDFNCVVRLDSLKDDEGEQVTSGGIIVPQERSDRDQMAMPTATLLAAGPRAFEDFAGKDGKGRVPVLGDRVLISKYAGITREADPLDLVRVCKDKEILAVLNDQITFR